jgi:putative aldouronate transport system permease protein
MVLPGILLFLVFHYFPMYGIVMAFQSFKPALGFFESPWVGLRHFQRILTDMMILRAFKNTVILGLYTLLVNFPAPILFALLLNEVRHSKFKRVSQTISYMPYFLSTVIVVGLLKDLLNINGGVVNSLISLFGGAKVDFFGLPEWFRTLYVGSGVWHGVGYGSIIYLAAMAGVNPELYEAAVIDGAGRLKQAWHITLPGIIPTVTILFIFAVSGIVGNDWQKILLLYTPSTYSTADVIGTYVYRSGIQGSSQGYAAAVGLLNSVISLALLALTNFAAKKFGDTALW